MEENENVEIKEIEITSEMEEEFTGNEGGQE